MRTDGDHDDDDHPRHRSAGRRRRSPADPCGAQSLQNLVGQPETVFFRMTFPDGTRYIGPGDAVTQDNQPRRINFDIDRGGVISRVWCG